jgi:hypothetical protein
MKFVASEKLSPPPAGASGGRYPITFRPHLPLTASNNLKISPARIFFSSSYIPYIIKEAFPTNAKTATVS